MGTPLDRHVVICIDNDPEVLSALKRLLRPEPYQSLFTGMPGKVLEWVRLFDVSLVLSDHLMPGTTGASLLQEVARRSPSTTRVLLTGYPQFAVQIPALSGRIECLISKPWDGALLRRTLRQFLGEPCRSLAESATPHPN